MKVIFASNYFYLRGGSEKVCFDEARILKRRNVHVDHLSINDSVSIKERGVVENNIGEPSSIDRLLNLFWNRKSSKKLTAILDECDLDILHAHNIYGRLSHSVLSVAKKRGIKVVVTLHDMKYVCPHYTSLNNGNLCSDCSGGRFYKAAINRCHKNSFIYSSLVSAEMYFIYYKNLLSLVDEFISPSKFLIDYYKKSGFPFHINHIPNFLPDEEKPLFRGEEIDDGYYLYVGRLSYEKGIMALLESFNRSNRKLVIIGDGQLLSDIKSYIRNHQLHDRVSLKGRLDTKNVHSFIERCSALIVPSEWYENAPITILEALAFGKSVLASDIGGIPEMVHNGKNGFLFTPSDSYSIDNALEKFELLPTEQRKDMRDYSFSLSDTVFSEENHYRSLIKLYGKK